MGRLNTASQGLFAGALGQCIAYGRLFPGPPAWLMFGLLLLPWLLVFTISFCHAPPFGPRRFRRCLVFAMLYYTAASVVGEALGVILEVPPGAAARVLVGLGALSFPVLIREVRIADRVIAGALPYPSHPLGNRGKI